MARSSGRKPRWTGTSWSSRLRISLSTLIRQGERTRPGKVGGRGMMMEINKLERIESRARCIVPLQKCMFAYPRYFLKELDQAPLALVSGRIRVKILVREL